ncbi:MAG: hypothetical protein NXY57DRAFT_1026028 [Lentinula lateritia]|nr:MAG: hypothetical protein NXY57DRAFT_1026028 [Lentinula lateritia]
MPLSLMLCLHHRRLVTFCLASWILHPMELPLLTNALPLNMTLPSVAQSGRALTPSTPSCDPTNPTSQRSSMSP